MRLPYRQHTQSLPVFYRQVLSRKGFHFSSPSKAVMKVYVQAKSEVALALVYQCKHSQTSSLDHLLLVNPMDQLSQTFFSQQPDLLLEQYLLIAARLK